MNLHITSNFNHSQIYGSGKFRRRKSLSQGTAAFYLEALTGIIVSASAYTR
jgi:hypothetical protein